MIRNLGREEFISIYSSRLEFIIAGKSRQELTHTHRQEQREVNIHILLAYALLDFSSAK